MMRANDEAYSCVKTTDNAKGHAQHQPTKYKADYDLRQTASAGMARCLNPRDSK